MSRRTLSALCFICAVFMIFNVLAATIVSAEPNETTNAPEETTDPTETTVDPDGTTATPDDTTAEPDDTTVAPDDTTADPDDTTVAPQKTPVAFDVTIPANFPTAYRMGDAFLTTGIIGTITYDDNTTAPAAEVISDAPDLLDEDMTITFSCAEAPELKAPTTLSITVSPITALSVSGPALNEEYYEGDIFGDERLDTLVVTATFADASTKIISIDSCEFYGHSDPLSKDSPYIIIIYCGFVHNIPLNIIEIPVLTGIRIVPTDAFSKYFAEGETFDPTGLMIMAVYSGGKNPEVLASDINGFSSVEFSPALDVALTFANTSVTVTYSDGTSTFTDELPIVVSTESVSSIIVSKNPNKMIYNEGDTFDYTGLELTAIYNDGSRIKITENFSVSHANSPFVLSSNGTETINIEITYLDKSCTLPISVVPADILSLTVLSKPSKLVYDEGETFDPTGLVLVLNYTNPAIPPVSLPQDYYTFAPTSPLTASDTSVRIYFRGEEVRIDINVIPEETSATTTAPPEPDTTPAPDDTTPDVTTDSPVVTTDPSVTTPFDSADETTLSPDVTTGENDGGGNTTLVVLWIVILSVIVIALVVLIIYYKRNFT